MLNSSTINVKLLEPIQHEQAILIVPTWQIYQATRHAIIPAKYITKVYGEWNEIDFCSYFHLRVIFHSNAYGNAQLDKIRGMRLDRVFVYLEPLIREDELLVLHQFREKPVNIFYAQEDSEMMKAIRNWFRIEELPNG